MNLIPALGASLGRQSIYRVVTVVLGLLTLVALAQSALGRLDATVFPIDAMLVTLAVLVTSSCVTTVALGRLRGVHPQTESAVITGLILWFLYWPTTEPRTLAWLAFVGAAAGASKYLLVWRHRHVVNPAAAGVLVVALVSWACGRPEAAPYTSWWVASEAMVWFVAAGGAVILWRLRRSAAPLTFGLTALVITVVAQNDLGVPVGDSVRFALDSTPIVFFACVMLTEPLTLAPRRAGQMVAACAAAVVFTLPLTVLATGYVLHTTAVGGTYELALVAANLVALLAGQRGGVLTFVGRRPLGADTVEVTFVPTRRFAFVPGQYVELDLAPSGAAGDRRGLRRMLSISSPPGDEVTVAVRIGDRPSAFKQGLLDLVPGQQVRASAVGGDFVLPRRPVPLALVAGGIGVTPYLSQLRTAGLAGDDVVVVYGLPGPELPYGDELVGTGARVVVVSPQQPRDLPAGWEHVAQDQVTDDVLRAAVPDLAGRRIHLSGPPAMVDALRISFPRARTDHFAGY